MTNDECVICQAPYHGARNVDGSTQKLPRSLHLAHVSKRLAQLAKNGKSNAVLEQHEKRLAHNGPSGAVKI